MGWEDENSNLIINRGSKLKKRHFELGLSLKEIASQIGVTAELLNEWKSGDLKNIRTIIKYLMMKMIKFYQKD
jgi:transcriptional regulator with XRE-family HTH domain